MQTCIKKQTLKLYEVQSQETTIFIYHVQALSKEEVERLVKAGQVVITRREHQNRKITKITEVGIMQKRKRFETA